MRPSRHRYAKSCQIVSGAPREAGNASALMRAVFVDGQCHAEHHQLPVGDAFDYFEQLEMEGRQGEIADKILKELRARYRFLVDVGLNYLPQSQRRNPVGW